MRVVYYDGLCGLCDRFIRFVVPRDQTQQYHYAPLQGTTARARLPKPPDPEALTTLVFEDDGRFRVRSDAALAVIAGLGGAWRAVRILRLIPRPIRDAVYDWIARHRFRWFGRRDACRVPAPEERERFLP
jgi:predicted DCC family thiol-disulfide oxidoreductase YuxK